MQYLYLLILCLLATLTTFAQDQIRVPAKATDRIRLKTESGAFQRIDEGATFDIVGYQATAGFDQINYRLERAGNEYRRLGNGWLFYYLESVITNPSGTSRKGRYCPRCRTSTPPSPGQTHSR